MYGWAQCMPIEDRRPAIITSNQISVACSICRLYVFNTEPNDIDKFIL